MKIERIRGVLRGLLMVVVASVALAGTSQAVPPDIDFISPSELHSSLQAWTLLDARPSADWRRERLPGSVSFSWEDHIASTGGGTSYQQPTPQRLASALGGLGMTASSPVVVYGDLDRSWGGEGWAVWVLAWLGHKGPIRYLDGGIQAWKRQGLPVVSGHETPQVEPRSYVMDIRHDLDVHPDELDDPGRPWVLIDTRSSLEWLTGRIPNAIHIPWSEFFTGRERRPVRGEALRRLLLRYGVDPERSSVLYCTAGVRSAYVWTVLALSGSRTARNYSGGMSDWHEFTRKAPGRKGS